MPQVDYVNSAGLVFIKSTTVSAATGVSLEDCFSSTYSQYKIVINGVGNTTKNWMLRMRVGGSDNSNTDYNYQYIYADSTTVSGGRNTAYSWFPDVWYGQTSVRNFSTIELLNPFQTEYTTGYKLRTYQSAGSIGLDYHVYSMDVTTSYTGFSLYPENITSSPTFTGTIYCYGYVNS